VKSLRWRLLSQFVLVVLVGIAVVWIGASWITRRTLEDYMLEQQRGRAEALAWVLAGWYEAYGTFSGIEEAVSVGLPGSPRRGMGKGLCPPAPVGDRVVVFDARGKVVYDSYPEEGVVPDPVKQRAVDIVVDQVKVGSVLVAPPASRILGQLEEDFLRRVKRALTVSAAISLFLALVLATGMSQKLIDPIEKLRDAAEKVSKRQFGEVVRINPKDHPQEIYELVNAFNSMSTDLALSEERKRELLRDIAHEIRTPLTILSGNLEAVSEGVTQLDEETLKSMSEEVSRLSALVASLRELDEAREGRGFDLEPVTPSSLVQKAFLSVQGAAAKLGISVETWVEEGLPLVRADPFRVQQVFSNLLSNALRYTPRGGSIRIEASCGKKVSHALLRQAARDAVVFSVKDSGPGIPDEDIPKVFERFFRGDRSRSRATGGSGLGLAIARSLVEGMGGTIWAENRPEECGSVFSFTLPVEGDSCGNREY